MNDITARAASRRGPTHIWSITYRNPDWPENQRPVTKLYDDHEVLHSKLRRLRSPRSSRPAMTILRIERIAVSGQWEVVDR